MTAGPDSTVREENRVGGRQAPARRKVRWTRGRKAVFGVIGFGSILIATVGFVGSYSAVRHLAVEKGFGWFSGVFPLGIDVGIAVLLALDLALTWVDMRFPLLRYMAWLLIGATVAFNAATSWPDPIAMSMHAAIPLLFITISEAVRHAVARATEIETDQHMDSIRLVRWLLKPVQTFAIWRDMKLWEIRSYREALERRQSKMLLRQDLRSVYGWNWRRTAPVAAVRALARARHGIAVDFEAMSKLLEQPPAPRADLARDPAAAPAPSGMPAEQPRELPVPEPALVAVPASAETPTIAAVAPAAIAHPTMQDAVLEAAAAEATTAPQYVQFSQVRPAAGPDLIPESATTFVPAERAVHAKAFDAEPVDIPRQQQNRGTEAEQQPVHLAVVEADDPAAEAEAVTAEGGVAEADLAFGPGPAGESKSERAERIYLAHQRAGVELSRPNLARWAGFANEGSGRTQYSRLERKHGKIVVSEGAGQLDFEVPADVHTPERA